MEPKAETNVASLADVGGTDPHRRIVFWCPGCRSGHGVPVPPHPQAWAWNGSLTAPTLAPSLLITYDGADAGKDKAPPAVCHSYVRDGQIQFLGDCTHALANQTVPLAPW